jgi:multiple antibiotic resistance protein
MVGVLAVACLFMLLTGPIIRVIGNSGAAIVSRVMGMIPASVAADAVRSALLEIGPWGSL